MAHNTARVFTVVLLALLTMSLLRSPGTTDVLVWKKWVTNLDTLGLAAGFDANHDNYPPFSAAILYGSSRVTGLLGAGSFAAVKLAILCLLFLTSFLFWLWTRDLVLTLVLHSSLLLNSVALGYIDVFVAPSLILALWALRERRWAAFTVFYTICCLTKWQPLIIAPFLFVYLLNIRQVARWRDIPFKRLLRQVVAAAVGVVVVTGLIFGFPALAGSFVRSFQPTVLSGNALNLNWVLTHMLHVFLPERFGGLVAGRADLIYTRSPLTAGPQLLFLLSYAITLVAFFRRDRKFEDLLGFSLVGYSAYFLFNTGVHENHLFLVTILAALMCWLNRNHALLMTLVLLTSNINLFIFYGSDGTGMTFSRVLPGPVDSALLFAVFNVIFFLGVGWSTIVRGMSQPGRDAGEMRATP